MIFYASVRGNADELAKHLLNAEENEHVTVHDIRGFVADDLAGALMEAYAISKGSRCKQFLFSLSLNPPEYADVPVEDFEAAIEEIERKLGLLNQPRVVVFHEKKGRRHCHAVWLRLKASDFNPRRMVGVQMAHFKYKLMDISRALFRKYDWKLPKGMERKQDKNPYNLSRQEYRQAVKRAEDPEALKALFKQSWETTDSKQTFTRFLSENGFFLAQGERRGYVAVDLAGKVYSLSRWIDVSTRDLKARLGPHEQLPTTEKARAFIAERMTENLRRYVDEAKAEAKQKRLPIVQEIRLMTVQHRKDRAELIIRQEQRHKAETKVRVARFPTGVAGIWERATGEYKNKCALNAAEIKLCRERDRKELHNLVRAQLLERQGLEKTVKFYREEHRIEVFRLRQEIARYVATATEPLLPKPAASAAGKQPLAAQLAQVEGKISLMPAEVLRREIARYAPDTAQAAKPVTVADLPRARDDAKGISPPPDALRRETARDIAPEKLTPAAQLAQMELKLVILSGDLSKLQLSLESNLISDEMRGRIRRLIEKTLETLQLKANARVEEEKTQHKTREYLQKQAEFNELVRQYAILQVRMEAERQREEACRAFHACILNMGYSLNGLPNWAISVMSPPEDKKLDERAIIRDTRQKDIEIVLDRVFNSPSNARDYTRRPPIDPTLAVPNLRANVLEVKVMLSRATLGPNGGGGGRSAAFPALPPRTTTIRFNAAKTTNR